jgi:arsenate reductase
LKKSSLRTLPGRFEGKAAVEVLSALSQPLRLELYRVLARYLPYGLTAGDIARLLAIPQNTLSNHLSILEHAELVFSRREGRSIIYAANKELPLRLASFLSEDCCQVKAKSCDPATLGGGDVKPFPAKREASLSSKTYNVLVLCRGNSARSVMAEAILNKEGAGRINAFSAGSRPKSKPDPRAIAILDDLGYETAALCSKSWDEFAGPDAPTMDFILTVCDAAAGETCPYWPGHPLVAHWGIPDPAAVDGTDAEKRAAFMETYRRLVARITAFVNLDVEQLDLASLKERLAAIGAMEGATEMALIGKAA